MATLTETDTPDLLSSFSIELRPTYTDLTRSNEGLISPELQEVVWNSWVAVLGNGFGSEALRQAIQSGFRKFIISDPDKVDFTNLNRQNYTIHDARQGLSKVEATLLRSLDVNPHAEFILFPEGTTVDNIIGNPKEEVPSIIEKADVIIDAMDPFDALPQAILLQTMAKLSGKTVYYPLELGTMGAVYAFNPETPSLADFFGITTHDARQLKGLLENPNENLQYVMEGLLTHADPFASGIADKFVRGEITKYPQLGCVTAMTAGLTMRLALQQLSKEKLGKDFLSHRPYILAPDANIVEW